MLVLLVLVGLGLTDTLTYTSLRNDLLQRVDQQLAAISTLNGPVVLALRDPSDPRNQSLALPTDAFGAIYLAHGLPDELPPRLEPGSTGAVPFIPHRLISQMLSNSHVASVTTTVGGTKDTQFRMVAQRVTVGSPGGPTAQGVFVVALPLAEMDATLNQLLWLELIVSGAIVIALVLGTWLIVRIGLRPLERMADTAGEIAAGDLSRRVDETDERTEVGRLGRALNVMLTRIETAFRAREESESRLRRFVADASHELRTPLTSIRGYAELFGHGLAERPSDLSTAMRRIDSESTRMAALVDDLLLLARLDQGRPLGREPVDLTRLAADAVQDARVVAAGRTITLLASGPSMIIGDDQRLRQLVGNLVTNAVTHTPPESPIEVTVTSLPATPDTALHVRLAVIDHGPGISPDQRAHAFERFWRSDPSRVRSHGGTGLGLSIVAAISEAHGSRVAVTETAGGGATFVIELPGEPPPDSGPDGEFVVGPMAAGFGIAEAHPVAVEPTPTQALGEGS